MTDKSVVLIGMMGAGKSPLDVVCSDERSWPCSILTTSLRRNSARRPARSFQICEQAFREAETQALRGLTTTEQTIIVTGGGIVLRKENVDFLKRLGVSCGWTGRKRRFSNVPRKRGLGRCCKARIHERRSRKWYMRGCHFTPKSHIFASTHRCYG